MRIVLAAHQSWGVRCLEAIHASRHTIQAVITYPADFDLQSGPYANVWYESVAEKATELGYLVHRPADINSIALYEAIAAIAPDIIVNVAYGQIYRDRLRSVPRHGVINIHGSLLPKYRGISPIASALIDGANETGVSVHYLEAGIDTGDIILQRRVSINPPDHASELFEITSSLYAPAVLEALEQIETGTAVPTVQDAAMASYYPRRMRRQEAIDWRNSTSEVFNLIRGLSYPFRGAYTYFLGKQLIVWRASSPPVCPHRGFPGQIISTSPQGVVVKTSDSNLLITNVQLESDIPRRASELITSQHIGGQLGF